MSLKYIYTVPNTMIKVNDSWTWKIQIDRVYNADNWESW